MPAFRRGPWRRVGLGRAAGQPYTIVQGCRFNSGHTAALRTDPARGCSHATKSATHDRRATRRWRRRHSASSGDACKSPRPNRISPSGLFEGAALAHHRHRHCRHQRTTMPTRIAVRNQ